jgi:mannose-6-phosphate isomerase-like protein (cupin superfamily)
MLQCGRAAELPSVFMEGLRGSSSDGHEALASILRQAEAYVSVFRDHAGSMPRAMIGKVRGTGPGVSFGALVESIRSTFSIEMNSPFEGSHNVAGGVMLPEQGGMAGRDDGFLFLRFAAGTRDLPMHTHENSHRLIYVLEGRGFFHVSPESPSEFTGDQITHVPVRSRDVLLFRQGTMHTFSTEAEALSLLSYHAPFVSLEDSDQYTVPERTVFPALLANPSQSRITCDPAWTALV